MKTRIQTTLKILLFAAATTAAAACSGGVRARIPTGVVVNELSGGRREFVATARASENAVAKAAPAMMMSSSLKAARLMIQSERQKPEYAAKGSYEEGEAEFLENGEYCRLRGILSPGK